MKKNTLVLIGFVALSVLAYQNQRVGDGLHWYSVIPPLVAVCLAILTHRVILSLLVSVLIGGLLTTLPHSLAPIEWVNGLVAASGFVTGSLTDDVNAQILGFVLLIISMISVMITSGGMQAMVNRLMVYAKDIRSTQLVTVLMGVLLFFDDYANTMIVGNSLRPLTDQRKISREKLAFLVDATSAPIAGIAILSTWIGYEVGLFGEISQTLGLGRDGYSMFFDALGFRFYCLLMIVFIFANAWSGKDYGPMRQAQERALKKGELSAPDAKPITSHTSLATPAANATLSGLSFAIPMFLLFVVLLTGIWIDGNGFQKGSLLSVSVWRAVLSGGENTTAILMYSALAGLVAAFFCGRTVAKVSLGALSRSVYNGARCAFLPIVILVLAWSLKSSCSALLTGKFLASTLSDFVSPLWFPTLLFIVAGATAFSTGTSWGTMAILIPTAIPVAFQLDGATYGLTTMISLGAILDGAIFGDHCSPLSDTTIMSSTASHCDHIHHVRTQIPYSLTVGALAIGFGYIPAALGMPPWASLFAGMIIILCLFAMLRLRDKRERPTLGPTTVS